MGILTNLIDRVFAASWNRIRAQRRETLSGNAIVSPDRPGTSLTRQLTIKEAINGQYIEFIRHKFNPKGPDDYENVVYIVRDGEPLVDAIATVLVLMDQREP